MKSHDNLEKDSLSSSDDSFDNNNNDDNYKNEKSKLQETNTSSHKSINSAINYKNLITSEHNFTLLTQVCNSLSSYLSFKNYMHTLTSFNTVNHNQTSLITFNLNSFDNKTESIFDIVTSQNIFINKTLSAFMIIYSEIDLLLQNNYSILLPFTIYGEIPFDNVNNTTSLTEGQPETQIATFMNNINNVYETVKNLKYISVNLIQQLIALYSDTSKYYKCSFNKINLVKPLMYLSRIFAFMLLLDLILKQNENLTNHWNLYVYMIQYAKDNDIEVTKRLDKKVKKFNHTIMSGNFLDKFAKNIYDKTNNTSNNKEFRKYLVHVIHKQLDRLYLEINSLTEINEKIHLFNICALLPYLKYVLDDKEYNDIYKKLWTFNKKVNVISLMFCGVDFVLTDYLLKYVNEKDKLSFYSQQNQINKTHKETFTSFLNEYSNNTNILHHQLTDWILKMNSNVFNIYSTECQEEQILDCINNSIKTIVNGILIASRIKNTTVSLFTSFSHYDNIEMTTVVLENIVTCLEMLKTTEHQFNCSINKIISLTHSALCKYILTSIDVILNTLNDNINKNFKNKNDNEFISDVLGAIVVVKHNIRYPPSKLRRVLTESAFDIIKAYAIYKGMNNIIDDIDFCLWKLDFIANLNETISSLTECHFLYWYRNLFEDFISVYINEPTNPLLIHDIVLLCKLFKDSEYLLKYISFLPNNEKIIVQYRKHILKLIDDKILLPIAKEIEIDLRVSVSHLNIDELEFNNQTPIMSLYHAYLKRNQEPFEIFSGCFIDIPRYITQYLNEVFYNMNALNMNDWSVYQQMKKLALVKYNLTLKPFDLIVSNDNDDGDLLCIVKKIITFIREYKYDFYMETFSEETKLNKQSINVININTIVKSFDVNGIGIVNSIVNKLFQVIGSKIEEILNIMLDDYIKSILMQEEKEWNTMKINVNNIYPLSSAESFYIKNMNFLDELLMITTELGNIMGVVRTIMSSIKEYVMKHLQFISNKDNINKNYIAESDNINIQNLFNECNNNLRNEINDLENAMKVNYLNVIIDSLIQGNDNLFGEKSIIVKDMRLFILCVPALTYAHLKQLINTQDELMKSTKNTGNKMYITNDGLIMGIVFFVQLFKLEKELSALNWFNVGKNDNYNVKVSNFDLEKDRMCFIYNCSMILYDK